MRDEVWRFSGDTPSSGAHPKDEVSVDAPLQTDPSKSVSDAIQTRRSVREFLSDPVPLSAVQEIVEGATRAASGGNLQPWRLHVLAGDARNALVERVAEKMKTTPFGDGPEYAIYPEKLTQPYRARRGAVAAEMYELVGIARDDSAARAKQMGRNFEFFGAPIGMVLSIDRQMGPPQFSDLGLFLGNLMLLARERGLHTCAQEAWSLWGATLREELKLGDEWLVFCGISMGYGDPDAAVNRLFTERAPLEDIAHFAGF